MKVLVTGASGMLGSDFCRLLETSGHESLPFSHAQLDVQSLQDVTEALSSARPDVVIHAGAFTNVDECERNPATGYAANTLGTENVALACARSGATMVYVSSCGIFDGKKAAPYSEFDSPAPLTHYARSKFLGEEKTVQHCARHFVVRPGWLYGGDASHKRNFIEGRRREAAAKPELSSASDKFGSPTYTLDFARAVMALVESEAFGLYHAANEGIASRFDYVKESILALGLSNPVHPVNSDSFPRSAPVPDWEVLDNQCARMRGIFQMRPWQDALQDYTRNRLRAGEK